MAFTEGIIMSGYLVKKRQIVAVLVFLVEIVGTVVLAQTKYNGWSFRKNLDGSLFYTV